MLRLGAVTAGVLGLAAAITGASGLVARPDPVVWASAPLDRPVVVIPPQVIAMDGVMDIVVEGEPYMETRTAQPIDAYAWLRGESSIVVRGLSSWTDVWTMRPNVYSYDGNEMTGDIWRSNVVGYQEVHIRPGDVPEGLVVVIITRSHTPLDRVSIEVSRDPGYGWAWPAISAGAVAVAISFILFAIAWLAPVRAPAVEAAPAEDAPAGPSRKERRRAKAEAKAAAKAEAKAAADAGKADAGKADAGEDSVGKDDAGDASGGRAGDDEAADAAASTSRRGRRRRGKASEDAPSTSPYEAPSTEGEE